MREASDLLIEVDFDGMILYRGEGGSEGRFKLGFLVERQKGGGGFDMK